MSTSVAASQTFICRPAVVVRVTCHLLLMAQRLQVASGTHHTRRFDGARVAPADQAGHHRRGASTAARNGTTVTVTHARECNHDFIRFVAQMSAENQRYRREFSPDSTL
jgi:hypothetical protein